VPTPPCSYSKSIREVLKGRGFKPRRTRRKKRGL